MDFVTSRAEFLSFVERLEHHLLMKRWLCFDQLMVHPFQKRVVRIGKRIVDRLLDGVIRISTIRIDIGYCMTDRTRNARIRRFVLEHIKIWIVESA